MNAVGGIPIGKCQVDYCLRGKLRVVCELCVQIVLKLHGKMAIGRVSLGDVGGCSLDSGKIAASF